MSNKLLLLFVVLYMVINCGAGGEVYEVTAYCSCKRCCGKWADGITASGKPAVWGVVAADWKVLPKGTRITLSCFPGQTFTVLDIGGAIKGRRIDVWFPSHREALEFGRKKGIKLTVKGKTNGKGKSVRTR